MDDKQKLLHFQGHILGLNKTGPDTYEVINDPLLQKIVQDHFAEEEEEKKPVPVEKKPVPVKKKRLYPEILINQLLQKYKPSLSKPKNSYKESEREIRSFSLVATQEIKEEAAILIKSLRLFHDEPVVILCDESTREYIQAEKFSNVNYISAANSSDLEEARSKVGSRFDNIKTFHRTDCIYKKMECIEIAIDKYKNTLFLDADIVVVGSLQENFSEDVVLSPHYHEPHKSHMTSYCGIFNAGYIFCADKTFPKFWKEIYLTDSTFYEQQGMNYIAEAYSIDFFHKGHNVGFWRDLSESFEDPLNLKIERKGPEQIKSFHVHMLNCIDFGDNKVVAQKNAEMRNFVIGWLAKTRRKELLNYIVSKTKRPKKTAFIHFGKCAGVYINKYMKKNVMPDALKYNSWEGAPIWRNVYGKNIRRDWSETELTQIANETFHPQFTSEYKMAHNHHIGWNMKTVKEFKKNDWLTYTFLRNPKDLICSLYFYARVSLPNAFSWAQISGQKDPLRCSLDKFINFLLDDEGTRSLWILPDYIDELDHVAEFNERNFAIFLKKYFSHHYVPEEKENMSSNKGFEHYYKRGEISEETKNKIESDPEYKKYFDYLDQV